MKVALKFVFAIFLVLVAIRTVEGILTVQRETARLDEAIQRDARLLGRILRASVRDSWTANGRGRALDLIEVMNVGSHPMELSWVPFEGEEGLNARLDADSLGKLTSGETVALRKRQGEKGQVQYFFVPIDVPEAEGVIQLAEALEDRSRYVRHALVREIIVGSIIVLASGAVVIVLGVFVIGRPLSRLRARINRIGEGNLSEQVTLRSRDELSTLAEGLNDMCARLSAAREREHAETQKRISAMEQMRHMDRLTTIGRLASGIAHELGTPLNVIGGRAGMISDDAIPLCSQEIQTNADTIKSQADRMTQIIRHLLDFARQRPPKRVEINGEEVVRHAVELVSCLGYNAKVQVESRDGRSSLVAKMDPVQMQQVMTNLIENALQSVLEATDVVVTIESARTTPPGDVDASAGRFLRIAVKDDGVGIAEEDLPHVFDPFFTTKDVGRGTGLGLSITYGIVREHGGWIDVQSKLGVGSCFTVHIPQEESP
ncbi:MAG: sensor histidine kinase [Planctomycetota bacterium]